MRFAPKMSLPSILAVALVLQACSGAGAAQDGNANIGPETEMNWSDEGNWSDGGNWSAADNWSEEGMDEGPEFQPDQNAADVGLALCVEAAARRFGFSPDDVNSTTFAGGGESPQTVEAEVTIMLLGPPRREFRCEIQAGAVVSTVQLSASGG